MQEALEADGEKLRQMTGEDHGPFPFPDDPELPIPEFLRGRRKPKPEPAS